MYYFLDYSQFVYIFVQTTTEHDTNIHKMSNSDTTDLRKTVKKQLKWGDFRKIAAIADVDPRTVERYFKGENDNTAVKDAADLLIAERQRKMQIKLAKTV